MNCMPEVEVMAEQQESREPQAGDLTPQEETAEPAVAGTAPQGPPQLLETPVDSVAEVCRIDHVHTHDDDHVLHALRTGTLLYELLLPTV